PFVGRQQELAELGTLLDSGETRLITLTGPGGIGKTRLALQAATEQIDCFADGVYYIPLADLDDTELVPAAITTALQIEVPVTADVRSHLLNSVREFEALLVLDNLEQLLMPPSLAANNRRGTLEELLTELLKAAPGITILATSR